ncbi:restriction endonuclease subunit S [Lactococcus lactis]|uniref:restriction endonuclease subunit S n=1 Tax=Lactococcus lactis TaxID=1358 RepID=UPI0022E931D6|nr:restriction endonuclease subunit S [Lactococcus lactis]
MTSENNLYVEKNKPEVSKNVPELRFKGFIDAWELRKLSDIVVRLSKSSINNQLPKVEFEDVIAGEGRLNKDVSHKFDDRKGILFEPNNILYGKLRPYLKNWLFADFKGIALGDFWVFKPINSEPKFIYCLIQSDNYQRVANDTSGTKMPRSDWKKVSSSYFSIPRSIEEQEKIGNLFKQLDNTITLHQRKLDKIKQLKQGYLQQLFPKNDEKVPRVRFANFDEDWEQRKLSDGMTEYTDRVFIEDDIFYKQVSVKNIGEILLRGEQIGSKIGRKRQAKVNLDKYPITLIFTRQTVEQGGIGFAPAETNGAIVTENMPTISININVFNKQFLTSLFKTIMFRKNVILPNIEGGTAQIAIHEDDVLCSELLIPSIDEQKLIGLFFENLDHLITLHQSKLDKLNSLKQALLQKLFV